MAFRHNLQCFSSFKAVSDHDYWQLHYFILDGSNWPKGAGPDFVAKCSLTTIILIMMNIQGGRVYLSVVSLIDLSHDLVVTLRSEENMQVVRTARTIKRFNIWIFHIRQIIFSMKETSSFPNCPSVEKRKKSKSTEFRSQSLIKSQIL